MTWLRWLLRRLKWAGGRNSGAQNPTTQNPNTQNPNTQPSDRAARLSRSLPDQTRMMRAELAQNSDFLLTDFAQQPCLHGRAVIFYFKGLTDSQHVHQQIVKPLLKLAGADEDRGRRWANHARQALAVSHTRESNRLDEIRQALHEGFVGLLLDGSDQCLLIPLPRVTSRAIEDSINEFVYRGPRDGFVEDLTLNIGLVRKRLKGGDLRVESFIIGKQTNTECALLYLSDIAKPDLVARISDKLNAVVTDSLLESAQLEELLELHPFSPFDEYMNTDRPDKVCADLLEGRIAIMIAGSPTTLIGPATFFNLLSSPADYYVRWIPATINRLLRFTGFMLSIHLSALYLSLVCYHAHLIPLKLVEVLMAKREQVPFPPLFEILIIQVMIDLVLEAILRLPTKLGQIIGVAGAIIIGQAAISANLIAPGVIIVVSMTTIAGFAMPRLSTAYTVQILRYTNLILASFFGGYGLLVSIMFWIIHLCQLYPLGKAYMSPFSPFQWRDMRDTLLRFPKRFVDKRQPANPGTQYANKQKESRT